MGKKAKKARATRVVKWARGFPACKNERRFSFELFLTVLLIVQDFDLKSVITAALATEKKTRQKIPIKIQWNPFWYVFSEWSINSGQFSGRSCGSWKFLAYALTSVRVAG